VATGRFAISSGVARMLGLSGLAAALLTRSVGIFSFIVIGEGGSPEHGYMASVQSLTH